MTKVFTCANVLTPCFVLDGDLRSHFCRHWGFLSIDYMQLKLNTRKSLKPECKQAAARAEDSDWSGILALCGGGGGSSQGHKAFEVEFSTDFCSYFLLLENAHSSINLDSMKKAKHILRQTLQTSFLISTWECFKRHACMVVFRVLKRSQSAFPAELLGCWS